MSRARRHCRVVRYGDESFGRRGVHEPDAEGVGTDPTTSVGGEPDRV